MDLAAIVALVALVGTGLGLFWRVSAKTTETQATATAAHDMAHRAHKRVDAVDGHVSSLRLGAARADEKFEGLCERVDEMREDVKELLRRTSSHG